MAKGVAGIRPKLRPPHGRQLERSYRPIITCLTVSGSVAVLIFVVFGLTAFNIYNHRFAPTNHQLHAGDDVSLRSESKDLSPVFCEAYTVQSQGQTEFYLLPGKADLDMNSTINTTFTLFARSNRAEYFTRIHYLTPGSSVSLSACRSAQSDLDLDVHRHASDRPAMFLVIVGDDNFRDWSRHFNKFHVKHTVLIPKDAICNGTKALPHLALTISEGNNYYFVLVTRNHVPIRSNRALADIRLTGHISRHQYNVRGATSKCNASEPACRFPLWWGREVDVVAQVRQVKDGADTPVSFSTHCQVRLTFWIPIFAVFPVVCVALTSIFCGYVLVVKQNVRSRYRQVSPQSSTPTTYGSVDDENTPLMAEAPPRNEEEGCASIQD